MFTASRIYLNPPPPRPKPEPVALWACPEAPDTHRYAHPGHCEDCGKELMFLGPVTPSCQGQTP